MAMLRCRIFAALLFVGMLPPQGQVRAQLTPIASQFWSQSSPGIEGVEEPGDNFGGALTTGDFNCDGVADLAIGAPYEDIAYDCNGDGDADANECTSAGAVHVLYGGRRGLHASAGGADQIFDQATSGVPGAPEGGDHFGLALAAIRVPGSNCDDLAVGAPDEDIEVFGTNQINAGAVYYFRGTTSGLIPDGDFVQGQDGVPDFAESGDRFGAAIAAGPLIGAPDTGSCSPGDDVRTLAIGAPGEDLPIVEIDAGLVVLVVAPCDLSSAGSGGLPSRFDCSLLGPSADCQSLGFVGANYNFGTAIATHGSRGPVDYFDIYLAVGVPGRAIGPLADVGEVYILQPDTVGGPFQFTDKCSQGDDGSAGAREDGDELGAALVLGDFDGDGSLDLAAGVPFEDVNGDSISNAGGVSVFSAGSFAYPTSGGPPPGRFFDQDDTNFGAAQQSDHFGEALAVGDFDADGRDDLVIGVPDEDIDGEADAGALHLLYGTASGLSVAGDQFFNLNHILLAGDAREGDFFGEALVAGDFDGDGVDDLAVGVPGATPPPAGETYGGGVFVLWGTENGFLNTVEVSTATDQVAEGDLIITATIARTGNLVQPISIRFVDDGNDGTATPGQDYEPFGGTFSWAAGDGSTRQFQIQVLEDTLDESNTETIRVELDPISGLSVDHSDNLTIVIFDDDVAGNVAFASRCQTVDEESPRLVTILRTGGFASGVTVDYASSNGSATAGGDYAAVSGVEIFAAGDTSEIFPISTVEDVLDEAALETVVLTLSNPGGGATLGEPSVTVLSIRDDDGAPILFADNFECADTAAWSDTLP